LTEKAIGEKDIETEERMSDDDLALLSQSGFLRQCHAKAVKYHLISDLAMVVNALRVVDFVSDFIEILHTMLKEWIPEQPDALLNGILTLS
jgi:hypothetical protein